MMEILRIQKEDIDIGKLIAETRSPADGAQLVFVGCVRDDGMEALEIEAFVPVAEMDLQRISAECRERFGVNAVHIEILSQNGRQPVVFLLFEFPVTGSVAAAEQRALFICQSADHCSCYSFPVKYSMYVCSVNISLTDTCIIRCKIRNYLPFLSSL